MDRSFAMRDQNIGGLLWQFSLPAIVGMIINALYNIVDRIFVGRGIGFIAIAATTVAFPIMLISFAVAMLVGIGATALISIRLGQQKKEEAERVAGSAAGMLIVLPSILAVIYLLFPDPILRFFGSSEDVLPYARDFTNIIMLGAPLGAIGFGLNNFIRAEGNPRLAMMTQIIGGVTNVVLNYYFIFIVGMGIKGSALGTVLGQLVSALWVTGYFFTGRSLVKIRLKNLMPHLPTLIGITSIGFAPFAMQMASSIQQSILNKTLLAYGGDLALSAVGIIMSILTLMFMPIVGLSQGAQPLIGFNYGARQYDRVKETVKIAAIAGTGIALAGYLAIHIWPAEIVGLFSKGDTALTDLTTKAMKVFLALFPVVGLQIIFSNYFQAVGKPVQSTILSLSRQVLLFIPALLILPRIWGIDGVWRSAPIADGLAVLLTVTIFYLEMKYLPKSAPLSKKA
ncbi:MAG: Multidrug export protein MepA [Firmicutes bacterium ADurb.Bin373]|nr:MATE family efflux transporter [Bacillota bacterium]OQA08253.1 MAG: Multidrug export protein MepA [Firmicutes bacterium ADurb.Bin373]